MPTNYNPDTDALETMQERFAREAEVDERIMRDELAKEFEAWYAEHGWKYVSSREGAFVTWKAATEAMRKRVAALEGWKASAENRREIQRQREEQIATLTAERDVLLSALRELIAS